MSTHTLAVPSTSRPGTHQTVVVDDQPGGQSSCTCEAAAFGRWCRHAEAAVRAAVDAEARAWCAAAADPELERRAGAVLRALVEARLELSAAKAEGRRQASRAERERLVRGACWLDATGDELWLRAMRETRAA